MGAALGSDNTPQMLILSTVTGDNADRINGKYVNHTVAFRSCPLFYNSDGRSWMHVQDTDDDSHGRWEISIDPNANPSDPEDNYPPDDGELQAIALSRHETTEYHSPIECRQWSVDNGNDDWSDQFLLWQIVFDHSQPPLVRRNRGSASSSATATNSAPAPFVAGLPNANNSFVQNGSFDRSKLFETISRAISQVQSRREPEDALPSSSPRSESTSSASTSSASSRSENTPSSTAQSSSASSSAQPGRNPDWTAPKWDEDLELYVSYNRDTGAERQGSTILANGLPGETDQPVQPVRRAPAQPVYRAPAQPVRLAPAQPVRLAPAQPVNRAPVQPVNREVAGLTVKGYTGPHATVVNGFYRAMNGFTLTSKSVYKHCDPWLNTWIHAQSDGAWRICIAVQLENCPSEDILHTPPRTRSPGACRVWHRLGAGGSVMTQPSVKVTEHTSKQFDEEKQYWQTTYPFRLCGFVVKKPNGLIVSGATGNDAHIINGHYERRGFLHNGAVQYKMLETPSCYLERSPTGLWEFRFRLLTKVDFAEDTCLCSAVKTTEAIPVDNPLYVGGWIDPHDGNQDSLKVAAYNEQRWNELKKQAMQRLDTQRARNISSAPRGIVVAGAIGPNADRINGRFGRDREPFNHSAVYVRVGRKRCWLRRSKKNNWVFGNYDFNKRSDDFGLARSVGSPGQNPVVNKRWEFETIGGWVRKDDLCMRGLNEEQWQALIREHQKFKRGTLSEGQAILRLRMQAELLRAAFVYSNFPERINMTHLTSADRIFFPLLFGRARDIPRIWELVMSFYNPETNPAFTNDDSYKLIVMRERLGLQNEVLETAHKQLESQTTELQAMRARESAREARMEKMEAMLARLLQKDN